MHEQSPSRVSVIRVVAVITAAATIGALVGMGRRAGAAGLPFAAIGAVLTHEMPRAGATAMVVTGLMLHVIGMFIWSAIFVRLAQHVFAKDWIAALVTAVTQMIVSWFVAWTTATGVASVLPLGDRLVFVVVLTVALVVGMRLARSM